jgi:hypothetical protein
MGVVQIDHQDSNRLTKRRTGFQSGRGGGGHPLTAAGAATAEQAHLRHVRLDGRQFDAFVDLLRGLCRLRKCRLAVRAGSQPGIDHTIRVRVQRPTDAGAALAGRLVAGATIGLLPLRRWQRGIVRRLGRPLEPGQSPLKFSDPGQRRFQPPDQRQQRQDELILLRVAQAVEVDTGRHTELESVRP